MSDSPDYDSGKSARPGDVTDRNADESDDKPDVPSDCDTSTWLSDVTDRNIGESDDGSDIPSDVSDKRISSCLKYSTHNTAFIFQGCDVHVKEGTQICSDDLGNWYDKFDIHNKNMTNHFLLTGIEDGNFTTDYLTRSSWNKDDILGLYAATLFICGEFDYDLIARALGVHRVKVLIMLGKFFFDISEVNKKWLAGEIDCENVDISRKFDSLSISDSSSKPGYYINLYDIDELVTSTKFYTDKLDNIQQTWYRGFRYRQSQRDWNNTTVKTYRLQEIDTYKVLKDFFETKVVYSDGEIPDWEKHIKIVQQTHVQQDT
ncbi:hypothetical protein FPQ18DRAFT_310793 [Pyronema domesticum]|nr:hypothetical protein FPQ18DRAFT_310793 [Pyronema domesticum]